MPIISKIFRLNCILLLIFGIATISIYSWIKWRKISHDDCAIRKFSPVFAFGMFSGIWMILIGILSFILEIRRHIFMYTWLIFIGFCIAMFGIAVDYVHICKKENNFKDSKMKEFFCFDNVEAPIENRCAIFFIVLALHGIIQVTQLFF